MGESTRKLFQWLATATPKQKLAFIEKHPDLINDACKQLADGGIEAAEDLEQKRNAEEELTLMIDNYKRANTTSNHDKPWINVYSIAAHCLKHDLPIPHDPRDPHDIKKRLIEKLDSLAMGDQKIQRGPSEDETTDALRSRVTNSIQLRLSCNLDLACTKLIRWAREERLPADAVAVLTELFPDSNISKRKERKLIFADKLKLFTTNNETGQQKAIDPASLARSINRYNENLQRMVLPESSYLTQQRMERVARRHRARVLELIRNGCSEQRANEIADAEREFLLNRL